MKILVSGSSGLIGSALVPFLEAQHYEVYKLVRVRADLLSQEIAWDPHRGVINPDLLEGMDGVVHLAGENLMGIWTRTKREKIRSSRVDGTKILCQNLSKLKTPPKFFICASAIGYYGNRGNEILTEKSSKGEGFLADVCDEWEKATNSASEKGIRTVNLRIGMVLSPHGGALKQMLPLFRCVLGGRLGSGRQYMSWITIDDLIRIIHFSMLHDSLYGPVNAVSPNPVTNTEWTRTLGHVLNRPTFLAMPAFLVKLIFGELGRELLLSSQRVVPQKLEEKGFKFDYPKLEESLRLLCFQKNS